MTDLPLHSARELSALLQSRKASAVEVLDAHLARIDRHNPALNAIVTLDVDGARRQAAAIDARRAKGEALGPFAGLPIAIKDMEPVKGMRSTMGSTIYRDWVPDFDSLIVSRFRDHGMVILGKTNTPEFAMGSQTFNRVFGATRNPWNLERTCGGSSGGAAVSVAMHMLPFADGTDLGGSLRNPGNFNHVFGLRPSPGRVPTFPSKNHWIAMSVLGPIARTASDGAFLLAAMAGADGRVPLSIPENPAKFLAPLERDFKGVRIAYSRTLGGLPVDHGVAAAIEAGVKHLASLGCIVEEAEPELAPDADTAFDVLRALSLAERYGDLLDTHRGELKDTAIWNIERGFALTAREAMEGNKARSRSFDTMRAFLERYDFLVAPVNQVPPFPVDQPYVTEINGIRMANYIEWMRTCTRITPTAHPSASVPCGFTPDGLPVGLQIVGRYRDEFGVLQLAHAFEQVNPDSRRKPPLAGK
jgi:amidase